jgi:hypothetical protein
MTISSDKNYCYRHSVHFHHFRGVTRNQYTSTRRFGLHGTATAFVLSAFTTVTSAATAYSKAGFHAIVCLFLVSFTPTFMREVTHSDMRDPVALALSLQVSSFGYLQMAF